MNAALDSLQDSADERPGCANHFEMGEGLRGRLAASLIRHDPNQTAPGQVDLESGTITFRWEGEGGWGVGLYDRVFGLTHEFKHIDINDDHQCRPFDDPECAGIRPDFIDNFGLACANDVTGENRSWPEYH